MSDTKQQCPACGSIDRRVRIVVSERLRSGYTSGSYGPCFDSWHDSPVEGSGEPTSSGETEPKAEHSKPTSVRNIGPPDSGSGAREWWLKVKGLVFPSDQDDLITILEAYADHCTAQLREQIDDAENAIDHCAALADWKPSTWEQHGSRVRFLCNYYQGAVNTIADLSKELTAELTRREAAERESKWSC